jgi:hypothetical protein
VTPTESGPRVLDGLTTSPLTSRSPLALAMLDASRGASGLPNLEATVLIDSSDGSPGTPGSPGSPGSPGLASTKLAEGEVASAQAVSQVSKVSAASGPAPALENSHPPLTRTKLEAGGEAPSRRRLYVLAGSVALALIIGVVGLRSRRDPPPSGLVSTTGGATEPGTSPRTGAEPTAAPTEGPSVALPGLSAGVEPPNVPASTKPSPVPGRDPAGGLAVRPVGLGALPAAGASDAGLAKTTPSTAHPAEAQPSASGTSSASVGGRTIRTEF